MIVSQTDDPHGCCTAVLHLLRNLGWSYLDAAGCLALRGSTREVILKPRLIEVLQTRRFEYRGESYPLSPGAIDQIVRELAAPNAGEDLLAANERLYGKLAQGVTVTEFMPDGRKHQPTIPVVDWSDPTANRWEVTAELEVLSAHATHHRVPDVVCYVNGLPLAVIEAGRSDGSHGGKAMFEEIIGRHLRHQSPDEIPQLFAYAHLLFALNQADGRYGTTHTAAESWARWHEEEFGEAYFQTVQNGPLPVTDRDRLLTGLLTPARLLLFLRSFVLFGRRAGKIVARHQQFFAARALLQRIRQLRPDGGREGGVAWHAAGSGKSFAMLFFAKAVLLDPALAQCLVLVVSDRLAQAIHGEGERSRSATGRDLARRIGSSSERIVFTSFHKFDTASRLPECRNDSPEFIVVVDEGHRSHLSETCERLRKALPRAACVAFTGAPLWQNDDKTRSKCGPLIHAYTMRQAAEDEAGVPPFYEERRLTTAIGSEAREPEGVYLVRAAETDGNLALAADRRIEAYYGAMRRVLGEAFFVALDEAAHRRYVEQAGEIDRVVRDAVAENSLNPQNIAAAITRGLLPGLFVLMGLDKAKAVLAQVIRIAGAGPGPN